MTSQILLDSASAVLGRSVGLRLDPAQRHRLDYWLKTTALARGIADAAIVQEIAAEGPALQAVLDELTVQETSFFRDRGQFDALRNAVLPTLEPPLTIWSAGCAWGQEPYSLAMLLDDSGYPEWRVVASDISSRALKQAQSARFSEHQLTGLSETDRGRYLNRVGDDHWEVIPRLRERVTVFRHNLVRDPVPPLALGSAVVFCRNVLIYFDRADVLEALDKIADTMDPTGWAFLGYSEVPVAGDRPIPPGPRGQGVRLSSVDGVGRRPSPGGVQAATALARRQYQRVAVPGAHRHPDIAHPHRRRPHQPSAAPTPRCRRSPPCSPRARRRSRRGMPAPPSSPCARRRTWIPTTGSPSFSWVSRSRCSVTAARRSGLSAPPGPRSVAARRRLRRRSRVTRSPN